MLKNHYWKFIVAVVITALIAGVGLVPDAAATTGTAIAVANCALNDFAGDENFGQGAVGTPPHLYVTWDASNLYLGINQNGNTTSFLYNFYIDTAPLGTYRNDANTFNIGTPPAISTPPTPPWTGYEYLYSIAINGASTYYSSNSPTNPRTWANMGSFPALTSCAVSGGLIKVAIPWANIGGAPSRLTILVQGIAGAPGNVTEYWPVQPATPPPYTQGITFEAPLIPGAPGLSPNGAPNAISLSQFTANNPQTSLLLLAGILVLGTGGFLLLRRRNRKQEI